LEQLFAYARSLGLDAIAITHPQPFTEARVVLEDRITNGLYPEFAERDLSVRINPQALLPSVKAIISVALAYKTVAPQIQPHSGIVSRYAWGEDYHRVLTAKLQQLAQWMQEHLDLSEYVIAVDTKPTIDRAIALRAGLGWLGYNSCVFVPPFGSWVFLGSILVDIALPVTSEPIRQNPCHSCGRCIKACPTHALYAPYKINPHICISYLTQMSGIIPIELRDKIGNKLWGCDTCQEVCPINKQASVCSHAEFFPQPTTCIPVIPLLNISKREFSERFGKTPIGWRGKGILQRNAAIVCGNQQLKEAIPELAKCLRDPKPYLRVTAAWALGKINTLQAREALIAAKNWETDPEVLREIDTALHRN